MQPALSKRHSAAYVGLWTEKLNILNKQCQKLQQMFEV